jgi:hypothetical protein
MKKQTTKGNKTHLSHLLPVYANGQCDDPNTMTRGTFYVFTKPVVLVVPFSTTSWPVAFLLFSNMELKHIS